LSITDGSNLDFLLEPKLFDRSPKILHNHVYAILIEIVYFKIRNKLDDEFDCYLA
jgi:hypothetical protein